MAENIDIFRGYVNGSLVFILYFLSALAGFITKGYLLSVVKDTLKESNTLVAFEYRDNFKSGIRSCFNAVVASLVYLIVPFFLIGILSLISGGFDYLIDVIWKFDITDTLSLDAITNIFQIKSLGFQFKIVGAISLFISLLFSCLYTVGFARLAKTGSLSSACNFITSFKDISAIGWAKYLKWYISLMIVVGIFAFVGKCIMEIPDIGIIIYYLLLCPFIRLLINRSIGLMYLEDI